MHMDGMLMAFVGLPLAALITGIAIKNKLVWRIGGSVLCAEALFVAWLLMETLADSGPLGRLFGISILWLAYVICGGLLIVSLLLIWKPFAAKRRRIVLLSVVAPVIILMGAIGGIQGYKNSVLELPGGDVEIQLDKYLPFAENTRAASLYEQSAFTLTENLPRLDGATALYPLYSAFVRAAYPAGEYGLYQTLGDYGLTFEEYLGRYGLDAEKFPMERLRENYDKLSPITCSQTEGAFDNLIRGDADVAFLMGVSGEQWELASRRGLSLKLTPIGRDAFVFIVNSRNRIGGLTQSEVRAIYSGAITDWNGIGDGGIKGKIEAYQRPDYSGSQTALMEIMGDTPIMRPKENQVYSMMGGLYNVIADYKNYKNAIGYSFRFYIEDMLNDAQLNQVRLLAIDGVAPTDQTIADGTYPYADDFYAVTASNRIYYSDGERARAKNAENLIDWILSDQGQSLVEQTGYARIKAS
jgi:phosphate transport system substrate-binding protein